MILVIIDKSRFQIRGSLSSIKEVHVGQTKIR